MLDIFISYAKEDVEFVEKIKKTLDRIKHDLNIKYFVDTENIIPTDIWRVKIDNAIKQSKIVICILSIHYFASEFIQQYELPQIRRRFHDGSLIVLPIFARYVSINYDDMFRSVHWLNKPDQALEEKSPQEYSHFLSDLENNIRTVLSTNLVKRKGKNINVRYNIVLIGKTGVGKTELVNYLFEKRVRESGIGGPKTSMGFHRTNIDILDIPATIWDSAGLEVGQYKEWLSCLQEELKNRSLRHPLHKWFHTVLYCIQAPGWRIEPLEVKIISQLLQKKYKVVIVITKAYAVKRKLDEFAAEIQKQLPTPLPYVFLNSVVEETQSGIINPSGKTDLHVNIRSNLLDSLLERVPARCIKVMSDDIDKVHNDLIKHVNDKVAVESKEVITSYVEEQLYQLKNIDINSPHGKFNTFIKDEIRIAVEAYNEMAYFVENAIDSFEEKSMVPKVDSSLNLPKINKYWEKVKETYDDHSAIVEKGVEKVVDNFIFKNTSWPYSIRSGVSEVASGLASGLASIVLGPFSAGKTLVSHIQSHFEYKKEMSKIITEYCDDLKKKLARNENAIRNIFLLEIRKT